jgi:hypothetical protein
VQSDEDRAFWDPVDQDGVPYFDPIEVWGKKDIYDATGKIREADLDTIVRELTALRQYGRIEKPKDDRTC